MRKANGLVVVERAKDWYYGVDRNPWPLSRYDDVMHRSVMAADQSFDQYDVTQSFDLAMHYLKLAEKEAIGAEILYCEFMGVRLPLYSAVLQKRVRANCEFLGWDYSWASGDFYSCIYNDISLKKDLFSSCLNRLNEYGLFSTENDADGFIQKRRRLKRVYSNGTFEIGRFYKVKVFRVIV